MEEEAFWFYLLRENKLNERDYNYLDVFFSHHLPRNVSKNDVLRIFRKDSELVWNPGRLVLFLILQMLIKLCTALTLYELYVGNSFIQELVARSDISFYDLLEVIIELFFADLQLRADCCAWGFVMLLDVDVHDVVIVELPSESDGVRPA